MTRGIQEKRRSKVVPTDVAGVASAILPVLSDRSAAEQKVMLNLQPYISLPAIPDVEFLTSKDWLLAPIVDTCKDTFQVRFLSMKALAHHLLASLQLRYAGLSLDEVADAIANGITNMVRHLGQMRRKPALLRKALAAGKSSEHKSALLELMHSDCDLISSSDHLRHYKRPQAGGSRASSIASTMAYSEGGRAIDFEDAFSSVVDQPSVDAEFFSAFADFDQDEECHSDKPAVTLDSSEFPVFNTGPMKATSATPKKRASTDANGSPESSCKKTRSVWPSDSGSDKIVHANVVHRHGKNAYILGKTADMPIKRYVCGVSKLQSDRYLEICNLVAKEINKGMLTKQSATALMQSEMMKA